MRSLDYYLFIGYKKIDVLFGNDFLAHHGIKGQKHGVRNGPPYPLSKEKHDAVVGKNVVNDAIEKGLVSKKVNADKQKRHTFKEHTPGRSYLNGDVQYAQELVDKLSGTGIPVLDRNDNWTGKEKVVNTSDIGVYISPNNNKEENTKAAMIVYSKTGSHIYPRKGGGKK